MKELVQLIHEAGTVSNLCLRGMDVPVSALAYLASIQTLKSLDLASSWMVTDDAIEHLAACKSLRILRISKARLPAGSTLAYRLGLLLPDCKIIGSD